jgi:hypothetical protein
MDRANRSVRMEIPELMRDINYFPQNNHAMFRLTATLGIVPDVTFDVAAKEYLPPTWYDPSYYSIDISTDWNPSLEGMESTVLTLAMDALPPDNRWTLMLSIGIEYGAFREGGKIDEVKRFGAAKILALRGKDDASGGGVGNEMGEEEVRVAIEATTEDSPVREIEKKSKERRAPEMRYVYTTKEVVVEKQNPVVYGYALSFSNNNVANTFDSPPTAPKQPTLSNENKPRPASSRKAVISQQRTPPRSPQSTYYTSHASIPATERSFETHATNAKRVKSTRANKLPPRLDFET